MMTREEIIEIEQYCSDHKVGKKARLAELGIPFWNFYRARRKYQREDELIGSDPSAGNFIQLATLPSGPALQPSKRMIRQKSRKDAGPIVESHLTIELRTASGTAMQSHPGKYDILPSSGTDISEQCSALMPATGTGSTTVP